MKVIFNIIQGLKSIIATPSVAVTLSSLKTAVVILPVFSTVFISSHIPTSDPTLITELESIITSNNFYGQSESSGTAFVDYFKETGLTSFPNSAVAIFSASTSGNSAPSFTGNFSTQAAFSANVKRIESSRLNDTASKKVTLSPLLENEIVHENPLAPTVLDMGAVNSMAGSQAPAITTVKPASEENLVSELEMKSDTNTGTTSDNSGPTDDELTFYNIVGAGLGSNTISDIMVDEYGIIYAATTNGLGISYDGGLNFINKNESDGIGDVKITCVFVDGSNNIYACNKFGLSLSEDAGGSFINIDDTSGLGDKDVNDVFVDDAGVIYAATKKGLSISVDHGVSFVNKKESEGLGDKIVNGIYVHNGVIYAATVKGLSISYDGGASFTNKDTEDGLGDEITTQVFVDDVDNIFVATPSGLSVSYDHGVSFINKTETDGMGDKNVNGIYVYNHIIYVATNEGLAISLNGGVSFQNYNETQGLGDPLAQGVFVNSQERIFVATLNGLSVSND